MPGLSNKGKALNEALAAVSLAIIGRTNSDKRLETHSFEAYGNSLRELRKALASSSTRSSQDTLAATMAVTTYEVCFH